MVRRARSKKDIALVRSSVDQSIAIVDAAARAIRESGGDISRLPKIIKSTLKLDKKDTNQLFDLRNTLLTGKPKTARGKREVWATGLPARKGKRIQTEGDILRLFKSRDTYKQGRRELETVRKDMKKTVSSTKRTLIKEDFSDLNKVRKGLKSETDSIFKVERLPKRIKKLKRNVKKLKKRLKETYEYHYFSSEDYASGHFSGECWTFAEAKKIFKDYWTQSHISTTQEATVEEAEEGEIIIISGGGKVYHYSFACSGFSHLRSKTGRDKSRVLSPAGF